MELAMKVFLSLALVCFAAAAPVTGDQEEFKIPQEEIKIPEPLEILKRVVEQGQAFCATIEGQSGSTKFPSFGKAKKACQDRDYEAAAEFGGLLQEETAALGGPGISEKKQKQAKERREIMAKLCPAWRTNGTKAREDVGKKKAGFLEMDEEQAGSFKFGEQMMDAMDCVCNPNAKGCIMKSLAATNTLLELLENYQHGQENTFAEVQTAVEKQGNLIRRKLFEHKMQQKAQKSLEPVQGPAKELVESDSNTSSTAIANCAITDIPISIIPGGVKVCFVTLGMKCALTLQAPAAGACVGMGCTVGAPLGVKTSIKLCASSSNIFTIHFAVDFCVPELSDVVAIIGGLVPGFETVMNRFNIYGGCYRAGSGWYDATRGVFTIQTRINAWIVLIPNGFITTTGVVGARLYPSDTRFTSTSNWVNSEMTNVDRKCYVYLAVINAYIPCNLGDPSCCVVDGVFTPYHKRRWVMWGFHFRIYLEWLFTTSTMYSTSKVGYSDWKLPGVTTYSSFTYSS